MEESKPETPPAKPEETKPPETKAEETKSPETKPSEKTTRGTLAARMDRLEAKQDSLIGKVDTWITSQTQTPKAGQPPSTPPKPAVEIIEVNAEVREKEKPPGKTDGDASQSAETKAGEKPSGDGGDGVPPRVRTFADNLFLRPR